MLPKSGAGIHLNMPLLMPGPDLSRFGGAVVVLMPQQGANRSCKRRFE